MSRGALASPLAHPPGSPLPPQFSLPLALQGAWSPSQLLETSVQACHEFEDSWILERKAAQAGAGVCVPAMSPQNETTHLRISFLISRILL